MRTTVLALSALTGVCALSVHTVAADETVGRHSDIRFVYDPKSGLLTWESEQDPITGKVALLMIEGPKPLGFPKGSPPWAGVFFLKDHVELFAEKVSAASSLFGNAPSVDKPTPILVYESELTEDVFANVTYATSDVWIMLAMPSYVRGPLTGKACIRFLEAPPFNSTRDGARGSGNQEILK